MPAASDRETGWLRYGNGIPKNRPFAEELAKLLPPQNSGFVEMAHSRLALEAFAGNRLGGPGNLYGFLGLDYHRGDQDEALPEQ